MKFIFLACHRRHLFINSLPIYIVFFIIGVVTKVAPQSPTPVYKRTPIHLTAGLIESWGFINDTGSWNAVLWIRLKKIDIIPNLLFHFVEWQYTGTKKVINGFRSSQPILINHVFLIHSSKGYHQTTQPVGVLMFRKKKQYCVIGIVSPLATSPVRLTNDKDVTIWYWQFGTSQLLKEAWLCTSTWLRFTRARPQPGRQ